MTTYYLPDLSGTNTDYLQVNIPCYVYQSGMKVIFENSPIHASSLVITLTDGTGTVLVKDTDWEIKSDDIDQKAMSNAFLENSNFTGLLLKSVTIKSSLAIGKQVAMTYQEFYLTVPGRMFDDGRPLELTPDLIKSLITGLNDVRQQVAHVNSPIVTNILAPTLLPFDINAERSSNLMVDEPIVVNTVVGAKVIRVKQGAFFADSVVLKYNNVPLNPTTDYIPIGLSSLTDKTTNVGGIYNYILITKEISGTLLATYRAVGGEVQPDDLNSVYDLMVAIKTFLNDGIFITSETVVDSPAFRAMHARLNLLEDSMRRLLTGTPTYGDSSSNNAVTRPISSTDADFHWWTVATLYQVEGSTDIVRADQFKGRVFLPDSNISLAFTVDLNLDQDMRKVVFQTETAIFDPTYTLFDNLSVNAPQYPMIRVVWNQAAQSFSGACIQFGVPLPELLDRMVVEDLSSAESCWILSRENEFIVGQTSTDTSTPEDSGFLLPDGISIWAPASNISYSETFVPEFKDGYLVYSGAAVTIQNLITVGSTGNLFNVTLPRYFPIHRAKTLVVTMVSANDLVVYDIEIPLTGTEPTNRVGRMTFADSQLEAMVILADVNQDELNDISVSLNITEIATPLQTGTPSALTDIVRYIRVKV